MPEDSADNGKRPSDSRVGDPEAGVYRRAAETYHIPMPRQSQKTPRIQTANGKRVTLKDVSRKAKVSPMTASRVLNRIDAEAPVKESTRKAVLRAAEELGYSPNGWAQAMRTGRTGNIGLIFPRRPKGSILIESPSYIQIIEGLQHELFEKSHNILNSMITEEEIQDRRLPRVAASRYVDGLFFLGVQDREYVEAVSESFGNVVGLGMRLKPDCPCVYAPMREAGRMVAEYMWDLGHRRFAVVTDQVSVNMGERAEGFQECVEERGGKITRLLKIDATDEKECDRIREVFQDRPGPSAIFCAEDGLAAFALQSVHETGLHVPQDVSVVGFGDLEKSRHTNPPLTTVGFSRREIGAKAAELMLHLVSEESTGGWQAAVPVEIVQRQSVGRAD